MESIQRIIDNVEQVVFGKRDVVKLCAVGLLARGHLLIEDVPGIGKTTLAQSLAKSVDCSFTRIQFTSDMLPSDVLGVSILNPKSNEFEYRRGPIFANFVLADEINRTPPKTQSALLEAMSEYTVSVDGTTHALPAPFMVIATQNPIEYEGTYVLPESQMDRFLLRVNIGYPPEDDERLVMRRHDPLKAIASLKPAITASELVVLQEEAGGITVEASVEQYILDIVRSTREHDQVRLGASPRGAQALFEASQARAMIEGRDFVTPDDVKLLAGPTLAHRLLVKSRGADLAAAGLERERIVREIVNGTKVPV
ncbi:MAG: MoxR family ATPase [Candidatus Hydrogenedentes bacterium]|nr:MoxR family ATPase [Candidatus Hydrogenedentota bacterium]